MKYFPLRDRSICDQTSLNDSVERGNYLYAAGIEIPVSYPDFLQPNQDVDSLLRNLVIRNLEQKIGPISDPIEKRLSFELQTIRKKELSAFFLGINQMIQILDDLSVLHTCAGRAASSLVCFALGLSHINPMVHGLIFEDFLNPDGEENPWVIIQVPENLSQILWGYAHHPSRKPISAEQTIHIIEVEALSLCQNIIRMIDKDEGFDAWQIQLADAVTWGLFKEGRTEGIIGFHSMGLADYLKKMGPENLTDIAALLALYQPGPPMFVMDAFVDKQSGPFHFPCLEETNGILVFSEQYIKIVQTLSGFSYDKAEQLRIASSLQREEDEEIKAEFVRAVMSTGISNEGATVLVKWLECLAPYLNSKSHSLCFAQISCLSAYLKAHYPEMFIRALGWK